MAEMAARPELACIKAGTLDNQEELCPQFHVYWRDHQEWIQTMNTLPTHDTTLKKQFFNRPNDNIEIHETARTLASHDLVRYAQRNEVPPIDEYTIEFASIDDADQILKLQKLAYISEAEVNDDFTIPPLHQTITEIRS